MFVKRHYKDEKNIQKIYQNISYWFLQLVSV